MAKTIYLDCVSIIKNKSYRLVNVPLSYVGDRKIVTDFYGNIVEPIYSPAPYETCPLNATIETMVDMFFNKVNFTFGRRDDLLDVHKQLKQYFDWVNNLDVAPADHKEFMKRAYPFFIYLTKSKKCILRDRQQKDLEEPTLRDTLFRNILKTLRKG